MNFKVMAFSIVLLSALSLVAFGLSAPINSALGLKESLLTDFWKLLALSIGSSILLGIAFPYLRGVRRGDKLIAQVSRKQTQSHPSGPQAVFFVQTVLVTALSNGWKGGKIKVRFDNGHNGEGIISAYQGTFSPATIQITESEL
ncbi:hypothetical protein HY993_00500 [Candidatus Micrarchaeota archaeon]|nr:hypothetical protein [Candidatus Micrarchaeota archaeon]